MAKGEYYYDTVYITVSDSSSEINLEYIIICDQPKLRSFDLNFIALFGIAVIVVILAVKTP